jgi:serine/threonine protein kinase
VEDNGKYYAIKSVKKPTLIKTNMVKGALIEKQIMFNANHPMLVNLEYLFQSETRLYFVMPYIPSEELYSVFCRIKRFPEEVVRFYAAQLALALGELHRKGFMHRDLKLENILLQQDGYLKLIDFGVSKELDPQELSQTFCGTPEYMAPEIIRSKGYNQSVDWWAFGILLYEMMFGFSPFFRQG